MPSFRFRKLLRSPRRTEAEVKSIVNDFPTPPVRPALGPPDTLRSRPLPRSPSVKSNNNNKNQGANQRWHGSDDTEKKPTRKTSLQSLKIEKPDIETALRPRTAVSANESQASLHIPSKDVPMVPLPMNVKDKPAYTLSRPSNIVVPPKNLLGLPSGLSPKEESAREKQKEIEELAAVARMMSGEASRPIKTTTLEIGPGRLSPGVRMPGSPGFTEDEMREWESKGLSLLE